MNLILVDDGDFVAEHHVRLCDRRFKHVLSVHRAQAGEVLRVGKVDGPMGTGTIVEIDDEAVVLELNLDGAPPPAPNLRLAVAMSRPPTLRKVLRYATSMGVKSFLFFHSKRVEKSYWDSRELDAAMLRENLLLGLEQARDTQLPSLEFHRKFRPFAEDRLGECAKDGPVIFADPGALERCPGIEALAVGGPITLVVGPEGGFIPYECQRLNDCGYRGVRLGPRILRVEVAVIALLARLGLG